LKTEIRCQRETWGDGIEIALLERRDGGLAMMAQHIELRSLNEGDRIEPMVRLSNQEAQMLIDELWRCGLRPSEGTGSAGSLAATEKHLADMQKIALGLLKAHGV